MPEPPTLPDPPEGTRRSGLTIALIALLPIACCWLPLLIAGVAAAETGAVVGGALGALMLIAGLLVTVVGLRRRSRRSGACLEVGRTQRHPLIRMSRRLWCPPGPHRGS